MNNQSLKLGVQITCKNKEEVKHACEQFPDSKIIVIYTNGQFYIESKQAVRFIHQNEKHIFSGFARDFSV